MAQRLDAPARRRVELDQLAVGAGGARTGADVDLGGIQSPGRARRRVEELLDSLEEPAHAAVVGRFLADLRGVEEAEMAQQTVQNASHLFSF